MKIIIGALFLMIALGTQAQKATSGLLFCSEVNEQFQPLNAISEITLKDKQASILYYYWNETAFGTSGFTYKTFTVDKKGKETLSGTISQTVQPGWRMVKQNALFTTAGTYRVKIYNAENTELGVATLNVK